MVVGTINGSVDAYDPKNLMQRRMFAGHLGAITALSESPDGRYLATGSTDRTARIWKLGRFPDVGWPDFYTQSDGTIYHVIPGGQSERAGVRGNDRLLAIDGKDITTLIGLLVQNRWPFSVGHRATLDLKRGEKPYRVELPLSPGPDFTEPLLSLFTTADGEWVLWTQEGYYDASLGGDRLIGWHVNQGRDKAAKFYLAQQFRKQFYRPDVIDRVLETGDVMRAVALAGAGQSAPRGAAGYPPARRAPPDRAAPRPHPGPAGGHEDPHAPDHRPGRGGVAESTSGSRGHLPGQRPADRGQERRPRSRRRSTGQLGRRAGGEPAAGEQ